MIGGEVRGGNSVASTIIRLGTEPAGGRMSRMI
jgi:hypothetical protein